MFSKRISASKFVGLSALDDVAPIDKLCQSKFIKLCCLVGMRSQPKLWLAGRDYYARSLLSLVKAKARPSQLNYTVCACNDGASFSRSPCCPILVRGNDGSGYYIWSCCRGSPVKAGR